MAFLWRQNRDVSPQLGFVQRPYALFGRLGDGGLRVHHFREFHHLARQFNDVIHNRSNWFHSYFAPFFLVLFAGAAAAAFTTTGLASNFSMRSSADSMSSSFISICVTRSARLMKSVRDGRLSCCSVCGMTFSSDSRNGCEAVR